MHNFAKLKALLDKEADFRNSKDEVNPDKPDPILIAKKYKEEYISLICSLFAYGNAKQIVKFLSSFDFSLLKESEEKIKKELQNHYYRFQKTKDVTAFFITIKRLQETDSLENIFLKGYEKENRVIDGIKTTIESIYKVNPYNSKGYTFLIGKPPSKNPSSPYKRWNMFLRWMVREDHIDFGLWKKVKKSDLIIPLDTHTFKVSQKLGLLKRKTYDFKAAVMLSKTLKLFDPDDPIRYDFALYRIGQESKIKKIFI